MNRALIVDGSCFEPGNGHDRLEGRAGRLSVLDGAIEQGMVGVVVDLFPILSLDAAREAVGIEGRPAHHGEHFTRVGIERDHRAVLVVDIQRGFLSPLSMESSATACRSRSMVSWRSLPGMAGLVPSSWRTVPRLSTITWRWPSTPVSQSLYCRSMPNLPITWPGSYLANCGIVQLLLADFAGVADDVRQHAVLRIEPALRLHDDKFGKEIAVRIDEGQIGRSQLFLQYHRLILGRERKRMILRHQFVIIEIEPGGDGLEVLFFERFTGKEQLEGGAIIDDHPAVAVENAPAGGDEWGRFDLLAWARSS